MARDVNKVILIGNVGSDPEASKLSSGMMVVKLSLATNRNWKDRQTGEQQERTEWHRLTFFGKPGEIVEQYVSKGAQLYVEGRIQYSQTQDDKGGTKYWTDIIVQEFSMLGGRASGLEKGGGPPGFSAGERNVESSQSQPDLSKPDDDLPF
jgi:single-strand DNA-binding protein